MSGAHPNYSPIISKISCREHIDPLTSHVMDVTTAAIENSRAFMKRRLDTSRPIICGVIIGLQLVAIFWVAYDDNVSQSEASISSTVKDLIGIQEKLCQWIR